MDQKTRVRNAIEELCRAIDWSAPETDGAAKGPFGLAKAMLKEIPHEALLSLPGFAGSWLHMLSAQQHAVPVAGATILSAAFPPAAMLAAQAPSEEARAILAAGVTSCVRPPQNDLLVLSPATADAAVYELTERGLERIAVDVAELVEREVAVAVGRRLGTRLPRYGLDGENWAVLVAGRRVSGLTTQGAVRRFEASVRAAAEKNGWPLAYVHMGMLPGASDEDAQHAPGVVGWVLAHASARARATVDRNLLDASAAAKIPSDLWRSLVSEHGVALGDALEVLLAPGGWSGASIRVSEDDDGLIMSWAEDTTPGRVVDLAALPDQLQLEAHYA